MFKREVVAVIPDPRAARSLRFARTVDGYHPSSAKQRSTPSVAWGPQALLLKRSEGNVERSRAARQAECSSESRKAPLVLAAPRGARERV